MSIEILSSKLPDVMGTYKHLSHTVLSCIVSCPHLSKMFDVGDRDLSVPTSGNWVIKGYVFLRFLTFFENPKNDFLRFLWCWTRFLEHCGKLLTTPIAALVSTQSLNQPWFNNNVWYHIRPRPGNGLSKLVRSCPGNFVFIIDRITRTRKWDQPMLCTCSGEPRTLITGWRNRGTEDGMEYSYRLS